MDSNELQHFGVKGMKWGVRRYQNYDGSYTKKGLERYKKSEEKYDSAKKTLKSSKESYKRKEITKDQYKKDVASYKKSKSDLKKNYDRLKYDKLADEGKELYKKGKTISGNQKNDARNELFIMAGAAVANGLIRKYSNNNVTLANLSSAAIGVGGTTVNYLLNRKSERENKRLRAYYGHTSYKA